MKTNRGGSSVRKYKANVVREHMSLRDRKVRHQANHPNDNNEPTPDCKKGQMFKGDFPYDYFTLHETHTWTGFFVSGWVKIEGEEE